MRSTSVTRASTLAVLAALSAAASAQTKYHLIDLGDVQANGVNDSGQVAGIANTYNSGNGAFITASNGGTRKVLQKMNGQYTYGYGLSAHGQVTGYGFTADGDHVRAFLSEPNGGPSKELGTLDPTVEAYFNFSKGYGVNASGQVTGVSAVRNGTSQYPVNHAFLSEPNGGALKDLGTFGGLNSTGYGVNDFGQVTGGAEYKPGYSSTHAFLSGPNGGALQDLGTLNNGDTSVGKGVNIFGEVVGYSQRFGSSENYHAFLSRRNNGGLIDLGSLGGNSYGLGVNDLSQAVGYSFVKPGAYSHAFVAYAPYGMLDLNDLLDSSGAGWFLMTATGINNSGMISGTGMIGNDYRSFLLIPTNIAPVPEPATVAALGLGALAVLRRRRSSATS